MNTKHPLYNSFKAVKRNSKKLGIEYGWSDFQDFYQWAIKTWEPGLVLTRINGEEYTPENCKFVSRGDVQKKLDHTERAKKTRKTMEERYGGWYTTTDEYKEKSVTSSRKKYGTDHSSQNSEVIKKRLKTNLEKYGVEHPSKLQASKDKARETCIKKYGVPHSNNHPDVINKIKQTMIANGNMYARDGKNSQEWSEILGIARSTMNMRIRKYGFEQAVKMTRNISAIEQVIENSLKLHNIDYQQNLTIGKWKPDFVCGNLIIECDGLYWHSDAINPDNKYHQKKLHDYNSLGYKCLFFREDEINEKFDIVQSIMLYHLSICNKIGARKCQIVYPSKQEAKQFFNDNHLMGNGKGKTIGLEFQGELVAGLQYTDNEIINIERFCNVLNTSVIGGFTKLLKYLPHQNIQTFIDRRYGSGHYLEGLGFKKIRESLSFKWVKNEKCFHRMRFPGNTGYDCGCYKLWDCGQALYRKL